VSEQRKLLQRSGGVCAFPRCRRALTADASAADPIVSLGEIAHIVGESVNGPRGASSLSAEERNRCENLILLCAHHHQLIDALESAHFRGHLYYADFGARLSSFLS